MSILNPEERQMLKRSRIARFYEMERQFYTVTELYPAQNLKIHVNQFTIMDIMNCDTKTACALLKEVGKAVGNEFTSILRTADFCDYMDIDEMLIQVFLASLHTTDVPLPPTKRLRALTREEIAIERPRKMHQVREDLRDGIMESFETMELRAKLWEEANPWGEPMYKRKKFVQMVIRAFEVAQIYGIHIRTAQEMLREVKEEDHETIRRRHVSIKKFCAKHKYDEEDLRKHLVELHGDDEEEDDD